MSTTLNLPIIDLSSPSRFSTANSIRQALIEHGFFYLVNHGVESEFVREMFDHSANFFSLPIHQKMNLARKEYRGYTPLYAENLDPTSASKGDPKEMYCIGSLADATSVGLNQWPSEELLPNWRSTMESLYWKLLRAGKELLSLIAMSLNLDEDYFDKIGASNKSAAVLRLLHYPGELGSNEEIYGASPHSDYGMITLLMTNGVPGLQICKEKFKQPQVWEDVPHVEGALIVNIGDLMERWTNCLYRSTLHRVMTTGKERYSVAFFFDPSPDCVVECFESCCSESSPPRLCSLLCLEVTGSFGYFLELTVLEFENMNRSWMYERVDYGRTKLSPEFMRGVDEFVETAMHSRYYSSAGGVRCPCVKCRNMKILDGRVVKTHLYKYGFKSEYWIWTEHGEERPIQSDFGGDSSNTTVQWDNNTNQFEMMHEMVTDAFGPFVYDTSNRISETVNVNETPNPEFQRFYDMLMAANQPIYEGCSKSTLSLSVRLLAARSNFKVSEKCVDYFAHMLADVAPSKEHVPKNCYQATKLASKLGMKVQAIDCYEDGCMLYYKEDSNLIACKFCNKLRFQAKRDGVGRFKNVPMKRMFYFPITPRLQRL